MTNTLFDKEKVLVISINSNITIFINVAITDFKLYF